MKHTLVFDEDEVEYAIRIHPEDTPIAGYAIASGDDAADLEREAAIRAQLEAGNPWAWCTVEVIASWHEIEASDFLGCCSYTSEEDFRQPGDYFDDMKAEALKALKRKLGVC